MKSNALNRFLLFLVIGGIVAGILQGLPDALQAARDLFGV